MYELDKTWQSPHNVRRSTHVESGKSVCVSNTACAGNLKNSERELCGMRIVSEEARHTRSLSTENKHVQCDQSAYSHART